jgi:hypothetical protein
MLTASSITSLSPATGATAAGAVVSGLNQTMAVGLSSGPPKVGDVNQFTLDFSSGTPQYSYGTTTSLSRAPAVSILSLGSSDWWDAIKHDLHSLEHSIRKGLTAVESVAAEWDDDLKSWAINLGLAIEGLGTQIAQFVVYDVHTAITAIHGIFNAIGADIDKVVSWIRMGLDDVIGHSEANARVVLGWMTTEFPAFATTQLDDIGALADGTFNGLKTDIKGWIDDIGTSIGGSSFTDLLTTPSSSTATVGSASSALTDITNILTGVHHNWLIDKIKSAVDHGPPNFASNSTLQADMESIDSSYQTFGGDSQFGTIASNMWSSLDNGGAISQGSDFKELAVSVLLSSLEAGLDDLVDLADDVVNDTLTLMKDTVDGLADSLTTTAPGAQLIVDVLSKLGVHADLSYGHIASMVAMFPTTLVYQFATEDGSVLFPADAYTASTSSVQLVTAATPAPDDFTLSLKYTHAVARAVLSVFQTVTDVNALKSGYTAGMNTMPKSVLVVTPLLSLLIAACTYPGTKTDGKTAVPFTTPPNTDGVAADLVVAEMACNWALGLMGLAFAIYPPGADSLIRGDFALAVTEIVAIGDMVVTITADALKGADAFTIATQALERTPPVTTFGVFRPVVDATDAISFFVKTVGDIAIDLAAGGMLLDAAIKAT